MTPARKQEIKAFLKENQEFNVRCKLQDEEHFVMMAELLVEVDSLQKEAARRNTIQVSLTKTFDSIPTCCPLCRGYYIDSSLDCPSCGKLSPGLSDIHNKCREALLEALRDADEWQRLAREAHSDLAQAKLQAREVAVDLNCASTCSGCGCALEVDLCLDCEAAEHKEHAVMVRKTIREVRL